MKLIKYILLGLIQGFTEPLPISSSGHVIIFSYFFNIDIGLDFLTFINLGSLFAIILYYRKSICSLMTGSFKYLYTKDKIFKENFFYVLKIFIALVPVGVVGLFFKDYIDLYFSNIKTVTICLLFTGVILLCVCFWKKGNEKISFFSSIFVGIGQIGGLLPGISRSGITTACGVSSNVSLEDSLNFSFLLYIPLSLGAGLLSLNDVCFSGNGVFYLLSFIASFGATYLSLLIFFRMVRKNNLIYFAIYCIILSVILFCIVWR